MSRAREQLQHLADPSFARLWERARDRLERDPGALATARTSLRDATEAERAAIGGLLGRRFTGSVTVSLADLDAALRSGPSGIGLVGLLERTGGPLRDRTAERDGEARAIAAALEQARRRPLAAEPWFDAWLADLRGVRTRMAREGDLDRLEAAVRILEALPADDVPIALFASTHAGGTKALDDTPLDRLVLHALAARTGAARPERAEDRRALWERFGVVPDDLASQVLVMNLPAVGDGLIDGWLRQGVGVPVRLTLHQLVRHPPRFAPTPVFVCENPAVVRMAAERLGPRSAAIVATEGRPSAAFWRLGRALRAGGADLFAHADFDAAGLEIAGAVIERLGASPWRFGAADYARGVTGNGRPNAVLPSSLPATPWDEALAQAMRSGRRVEEEEVLDVLLSDLVSPPP